MKHIPTFCFVLLWLVRRVRLTLTSPLTLTCNNYLINTFYCVSSFYLLLLLLCLYTVFNIVCSFTWGMTEVDSFSFVLYKHTHTHSSRQTCPQGRSFPGRVYRLLLLDLAMETICLMFLRRHVTTALCKHKTHSNTHHWSWVCCTNTHTFCIFMLNAFLHLNKCNCVFILFFTVFLLLLKNKTHLPTHAKRCPEMSWYYSVL